MAHHGPRRTVLGALLVGLVAASALLTPVEASAETCGDAQGGCTSGGGYIYNGRSRGYQKFPPAGPTRGPAESRYLYRQTPAGGLGKFVLCLGIDEGMPFRVWRAPRERPTAWEYVETICVKPTETITIPEITAEAREQLRRDIGRPEVHWSPPGQGVTNLPVLVWTRDQGEQTLDITVPLPGRIEARPTYAWVFDNGRRVEGTGRPFDGTLPSRDPGRYVSHTFRKAGGHSVRLEATWTAFITVEGNAPQQLDPLVYTEERRVGIVESSPRLVGE